jgi:dGTPase
MRTCSFDPPRRIGGVEATATLEDRVRAWEAEFLSDLATPSYPARRRAEEADSPLRTPFQRDRDRIVHTKAFRRLKHKTQVFIAPEGDHYRTRLTHTLEACGIARTVARALGLNEDLTEAIGLGHDLGHPPFGHTGEAALDAALRERCGSGFRHNVHSLRVVDVLEREGHGLNLTEQVRDGILNHTGSGRPATLEGRIVKLVDRVAYINHDIDDALRAGILRPDDLPAAEIELLGPTGSSRIDTLVRDIVERSAEAGDIVQSEEVGGAMLRLRKFMFERVYLGEAARREQERVQGAIRGLFDHYMEHPGEMPAGELEASNCQRVTDHIAGMTDRYCIARFAELTVPEEASFRWR